MTFLLFESTFCQFVNLYLDTQVPCGVPGSQPGSRETSDLPSYCNRLHQSTDCPCGPYRRVLHWLQENAASGLCVNSLLTFIAHAAR